MICYVDPSALVKRYVQEPDTDKIIAWLASAEEIAVSLVAYPEVLSAIYRKRREGRLSLKQVSRLFKVFENQWDNFYRINLSLNIVKTAGHLIARYPLRGFDAIHIASALAVKKKLKTDIYFLSFDLQQKQAASGENLIVI